MSPISDQSDNGRTRPVIHQRFDSGGQGLVGTRHRSVGAFVGPTSTTTPLDGSSGSPSNDGRQSCRPDDFL